MNERDIFTAARELTGAADREALLDQACAGDQKLRGRVVALLDEQAQLGSFLEHDDPPAAAIHESLSERPGTVIGAYRLLEQIGEGGFGVVFLAEQTQPVRRQVALKVIKPGMDSRQVIARFEAERQALAMMDHVNIARVFEAGATDAGRPYFVMELVHGVPITKYCDDNHLTPRQRLELFVPVCQAIQHAHQKGIIHRDIKPSNVMVTLYDGKPVPKVIDFGVAKATEQKLTERTLFTHYGAMVGTFEYMSPEQAEMSDLGIDTRSDIYSLGVLLYELLTGSTPLTHKMKEAAYADILRMIKEEEPPKPSTRLSDSGEALASISANRHTEPAKLTKLVRGELDWIVMKTLEKDRNRRYETAKDFAADVQRYLDDEPVQACPPSAGYRLRKFSRRNRGAVLVTGVVFLLLLGGVAGTTVGMVRARHAEREARDARERIKREQDAAVEARKESFDALIDVTDFTDRHLLLDHRAYSLAEGEFLQRLDALYERLGATLLDATEAHDRRVHSLSPVGHTDSDRGAYARDLDAWRRAAELYPGLPPANATDTAEARSDLREYARRCRAVALTAEKLRRWPDAVEFSRRQLEFGQAALAPGERPDLKLFNLLVTGNWCLTISLLETGQLDEALAAWEEMVRLAAWSEPGGINVGACEHLSRIAAKLTAAGKAADPAAILAPGLAEQRAKLTANPAAAEARIDLRRGYRVLGLIHEKSRRFHDALDAFDKVIAIDKTPPQGEDFRAKNERQLVVGAFIGRAVCLDALGREEEARTAWKSTQDVTASNAENWFTFRATRLAYNGQPERAVQMAEETLLRPGSKDQYDAACVHAIASADSGLSPDRKEQFARRAVALLEEAKVVGAFDPDLVTHAKTDADLKPLRGRDDFKKLMATLQADKAKEKNKPLAK